MANGLITSSALYRMVNPERVILLHGLGQTKHYMRPMAARLRASGFQVENYGYPSRRAGLEKQAELLAAALQPFASEPLSFVTHSLGGIIVRKFALQYPGQFNLQRLVMLGPPNQGSTFARGLLPFPPRRFLWGPVLEELANLSIGPASDKLEIGVIAGSFPLWLWPFLKSAHDGIVTVEETKLSGAKEHVVVTHVHASLLISGRVATLAKQFLRTGSFKSA